MSFFTNVHSSLRDYHSFREVHQKRYVEFNTPFTYDDSFPPNSTGSVECLLTLAKEISANKGRVRILDLGTKRSKPDIATHARSWFEGVDNLEFVMSDYQDGIDVDFVWDLHKAPPSDKIGYFDIILNRSVLEHVKYPHLVATNLLKALSVSGVVFVQTHQTFPLHGYVHDYFRFSVEALKALFPPSMNCEVLQSYYSEPCAIMPVSEEQIQAHNDVAESYMMVYIMVRKTGNTPETFKPYLEDNTY